MKKVSVLLVAILAISCSEDQIPDVENSKPLENVAFRKGDDVIQLIDGLVATHSNSIYTVPQLIESIEKEAFKNNAFNDIANKGYEQITESEIILLSTNSLSQTITATNYSQQVKSALNNILDDNSSNNLLQGLQTNAEIELIKTCISLFDTGDDNDRGVRTIGFAYGNETSQANGIIIAAIMTILANQQ